WNDFCDWYVEVSKSKLQSPDTKANCLAIQDFALRQTLLLLHPFIPFITEELWRQLGFGGEGELLMRDGRVAAPAALAQSLAQAGVAIDTAQAESMAAVKEFVSQARALKAEKGLASRRDLAFHLAADDAAWAGIE